MTVRLMQVGLGRAGRHWLKNVLSQHKEVIEVVALVDANAQAVHDAQEVAGLPPERTFTDLGAALDAVACDAVLLVTTLPSHVPLALQALNAGKHVLLEKPFAPSLSEALQVVEAAERNQRVLLINQNYRYFPAVRVVKEILQEERLGPVGVITVDFRRYANSPPFGSNPHYTLWQPLLVDMAIHHFDLMRYILGRDPLQISCSGWNPPWSKFNDPAAATASILFPENIVVNYRGSWVSTGPETNWGGEWRVECERGEIRWSTRGITPQGPTPDWVTLHPLHEDPYPLALPDMTLQSDWHGSLLAFAEAIITGKEPESSGRNNLLTLALTLGAVESANTHLPVEATAMLSDLPLQPERS
jgi:predicted dehydrogenase